jgi:hypothetical protein
VLAGLICLAWATPDGYARLLAWLRGFGTVGLVGIEGCDTRSHVVSELVEEVWLMPGT